jgi:hypothetical protein
MAFVHRRFKKHFYRAKRVHESLGRKGTFGLHLAAKQETQTLEARFRTPDEQESVRFSMVMRPFLDPESEYHYRKVWAALRDEAGELLSQADRDAVLDEIAAIESGDLGFKVNGQSLAAHDIYSLVAQAGLFDEEASAATRLQRLTAVPILGPFTWYLFYSFSTSVFHFVARLYSLSIEIGRTKPPRQPASTPNKCLFCLRTDRRFTSEEHVLPEALGNDETVLPPGYVCDDCNAGVLATLEDRFVNFGPIAALRVQFVQYGKRGQLPSAQFAEGTWKRTGPRTILISVNGDPPALGDTVTFTDKRPFSAHHTARALFKIALELVAHRWGHAAALDPKYDAAREFVHGTRTTFPGHLFMAQSAQPQGSIETTLWPGFGTLVSCNVFGLVFVFGLETAYQPDPTRVPPAAPFKAFDLQQAPLPEKRPRGESGLRSA